MKNKKLLLFIFVMIMGVSCVFFLDRVKKNFPVEFSTKIPVIFQPWGNRPLFKVKIENSDYNLLIDLGSDHTALQRDIINRIKNKERIGFATTSDLIGNIYKNPGFCIPCLKIQNISVVDEKVAQEDDEFAYNTFIPWGNVKKENVLKKDLGDVRGRIGWPFFKPYFSFFDFSRSVILLGGDKKGGVSHSLDQFIKTPFKLEKMGVVFSLDTDVGEKKFLLDTGATHSMIKPSAVSSSPQEESSRWFRSKLGTPEMNLENWKFLLVEMPFTELDGILGCDFFLKHKICIDFENRLLYIRPVAKETLLERLMSWLRNALV
jgi:hypothetical protein